MPDTVETLRADLNALRAEFNTLKAAADPVIDAHKPHLSEPLKSALDAMSRPLSPLPPPSQ